MTRKKSQDKISNQKALVPIKENAKNLRQGETKPVPYEAAAAELSLLLPSLRLSIAAHYNGLFFSDGLMHNFHPNLRPFVGTFRPGIDSHDKEIPNYIVRKLC